MNDYKDIQNEIIEDGDIVCFPYSRNKLQIGIVIGFEKKQVKIESRTDSKSGKRVIDLWDTDAILILNKVL